MPTSSTRWTYPSPSPSPIPIPIPIPDPNPDPNLNLNPNARAARHAARHAGLPRARRAARRSLVLQARAGRVLRGGARLPLGPGRLTELRSKPSRERIASEGKLGRPGLIHHEARSDSDVRLSHTRATWDFRSCSFPCSMQSHFSRSAIETYLAVLALLYRYLKGEDIQCMMYTVPVCDQI